MKAWLALCVVLCCSAAVSANGVDDKINQAVEAFKQNFLNRPPFNQYIMSVQFTTLEAEKQYHNDIQLSHDEDWSSWCLDVTVGVNLPENIKNSLPPTFWEFKVFYNPVGTTPYDPSKSSDSTSEDSSSNDGVMCNMIAYKCPDGTYASRTSTCGFVCGSQPIGNLSYERVDNVRDAFALAFPAVGEVGIETLYGKQVDLLPGESLSDYCLTVALYSDDSASKYPEVYDGVRVFYYTYTCNDRVCDDGSVVSCSGVCPEEEGNTIMVPLSAILFVVTLFTCCCCVKRTLTKRSNQVNKAAPVQVKTDDAYPSEHYELLKYQEELAQHEAQMAMMMSPHMMPMPMMPMPMMMPMSPQMAAQMGLPPMPQMPPMLPNGQFPVMMQAPNGMWFPAPAHPEDTPN